MNGFSIAAVPSTIPTPTTACFSFRKRRNRIDWRSLASVDVDRIAREMDFQALQANVMNIAFCNVDLEEFHDVDANFIKLFRLAQLIIEYLLHSQQYLTENVAQFEKEITDVKQDLAKAQDQLSTKASEIKSLKKENRRRRKVIEAYQDMLNARATGLCTCEVCNREFMSPQYLQSHILRRHPDHLPPDRKDSVTHLTHHDALEKRLLEQMMEHFHVSEKQLREELEKKKKELLEAQAKELVEWKKSEQSKMKMEMQEFKEPILADLKNLQQEKVQLEEALQHTEAELHSKNLSHIGHLEGAKELFQYDSKKLVDEAKAEVAQLKEQLESQVQKMQSSMKQQEQNWKKQIQKLGTTYQNQLKDSMDKLETMEQSLRECSQEKDLNHRQALLSQQITSFHLKLKHHEDQLLSQQQQLSSLQSRESSPTPAITSATTLAKSGPSVEIVSLSESEEEISMKEEIDGTEFFTPLKHRPEIRTLYDHRPEVLENFRHESVTILNDAMEQRGFSKNVSGITVDDLDEKKKTLDEERQQRVHAHCNFAAHRKTLNEKLINITAQNFKIMCQKADRLKEKALLSSAVGSRSVNKPPKPTPSNKPLQPVDVVTTVITSHSSPTTKGTTKFESLDNLETKEVLTDAGSKSLSESEAKSESCAIIVVHSDVQAEYEEMSDILKQSSPYKSQSTNEDNPWDSENSSVEELPTQFSFGQTFSTPVVIGKLTNKTDVTNSNVSIYGKQNGPLTLNESDDSWDDSEFSNSANSVETKQRVKALVLSNSDKQISRTATSQSALTTVSLGDLEDSELSDWT